MKFSTLTLTNQNDTRQHSTNMAEKRTGRYSNLAAENLNVKSVNGKLYGALRVLDDNTVDPAINPSEYDVALIRCDDGAGGSNAPVLANGSVSGQVIRIIVKDGPVNATVQGAFYNMADGSGATQATISSPQCATFVWIPTRNWVQVSGTLATFS